MLSALAVEPKYLGYMADLEHLVAKLSAAEANLDKCLHDHNTIFRAWIPPCARVS